MTPSGDSGEKLASPLLLQASLPPPHPAVRQVVLLPASLVVPAPTLPTHEQGGVPLPGHAGPLTPNAVFSWSPGELPDPKHIEAMSYEELVSFAGAGEEIRK